MGGIFFLRRPIAQSKDSLDDKSHNVYNVPPHTCVGKILSL